MSVTAERLMVEVQADVRQALSKLDQVEKRAASSSSRLSKMAKGMGLAFGGAAIVGGITKTIHLAMDFDKTMRQVGVQTGQTGKSLAGLTDLAMKMGKETVFSAQDASGAMLELSKGGLNAAQIRAGALEQTLRLAAAGGLELGNAAGYIVQGLNTYGLKANQAGQVTTALAGGANASTASVESLGMALSQVGPGATNAGMSIQETVAALAAFDNAGIKGSDAGTSLKTMLARLVPPTNSAQKAMDKFGMSFLKRNGDFKSMAQVAQILKNKLGGLSEGERTAALSTMFGSDATRAATVLMKEGAKGVQKYIRATKDRKKTQEMADSAMQGASGAWENFTGSVETAAIQVGTKLLPAFTKAANYGADFIGQVMAWGPQLQSSLGWIAPLGQSMVGPLKLVFGIVKTGAEAFGALPGPVKETAVQVGIAALVFPRLAAAAATAGASVGGAFTTMGAKARQLGAEMTYAETRSQRLGQAARMAAGVGGMMMMAKAAKETSSGMAALKGAAAGALMGFSVAGPIGGAVGAGAGALWGLNNATKQTGMSMDEAKGQAVNYAASLDQITGAATAATRSGIAQNLQQRGVIANAQKVGVSTRDLVSAIMGQKGAQDRVNASLDAGEQYLRRMGRQGKLTNGMYEEMAPALGQVREFMGSMIPELAAAQRATRASGQATQTWAEALRGVPKEVRTKLKQDGYKESIGGLKKLVQTYDMTPKQIRTMVTALGVNLTKGQLKALTGDAKALAGLKVTVKAGADTAGADAKLEGTKRRAQDVGRQHPVVSIGANDYASGLISRVSASLANLNGRRAVTYIDTINRSFNSKRAGIGFSAGGYTGGQSAKDVVGVVHGKEYVMDAETTDRALPLLQAIHAAKGRVFGYASGGQVGKKPGAPSSTSSTKDDGKKDEKKKPAIWGHDLVKEMVKGIREGLKETHKVFKGLDKTIQRNMSGKKEKDWLRRSNQTERHLEKVWARQADVVAKLTRAQENLDARRQQKSDFISSTTEGMTSQATVLNAGNSAGAIRNSLTAQVAKVKKFAGMLKKLKSLGFSNAVISQVAGAGVEGGYAAAEALVAASRADVGSINASFSAISSAASSTAQQLGASMYDSGIQAAQGLVNGLKARKKDVEATITAIAMAMQKALRKALGIHSPSRVMAGEADHTVDGYVNQVHRRMKDAWKAGEGLGLATIGGVGAGKGPSVAALQGGQRAGSSISFTFITHNPQAEPQSRTTNRALARVASLSLV